MKRFTLFSRSPTESRKRHEEKQQKARELREKLLQEKAERLRLLTKKVRILLSIHFSHDATYGVEYVSKCWVVTRTYLHGVKLKYRIYSNRNTQCKINLRGVSFNENERANILLVVQTMILILHI